MPTILATPWLMAVPYAADAVQREALIKQAKTELQNLLEADALSGDNEMLADVRRIQPFAGTCLGRNSGR